MNASSGSVTVKSGKPGWRSDMVSRVRKSPIIQFVVGIVALPTIISIVLACFYVLACGLAWIGGLTIHTAQDTAKYNTGDLAMMGVFTIVGAMAVIYAVCLVLDWAFSLGKWLLTRE
jgi:hypothetical protein